MIEPLLVHEFLEGGSPEAPLVLFVHGRGGNLTVTRPFLRTVPDCCHKLFVQAPYEDPDVGGYSWWRVGTEDSPFDSAELLATFLLTFLSSTPAIQPHALAALGFSQGGALLSILMQERRIAFSQVALLASFVIRTEDSLITRATLPEVFVAHGELDTTIPVEKARKGVEFLREKGYTVFIQTDENTGHKVGTKGMRALQTWFTKLDR